MQTQELSEFVLGATARLLRPLVRVLLRYGVSYSAFSELAKRLFVEVATQDFTIPGKKQTASRISTMTGLSRKEVVRVAGLSTPLVDVDLFAVNRAARVISGWVNDDQFRDDSGDPAVLPFDQGENSFVALVKRYSGDITPRTIADELQRVGAVQSTRDGGLQLLERAYVVNASERDKLAILGHDVADMIGSIDHNLQFPATPYFQRKVAYSSIPVGKVPMLREQMALQAQTCLENMDSKLAVVARQESQSTGEHVRIGVGIYYFEANLQ